MGLLEQPVCCPHCNEPQAGRMRLTPGNMMRLAAEFGLLVVLTVISAFTELPLEQTKPPFKMSFRCRYCDKSFSADSDERYWKAKSPNRCNDCGYDLRGNTSGRCPECGTPDSRVSR